MPGGFAASQGLANARSYNASGVFLAGGASFTNPSTANVKGAWSLIGVMTADCSAFLLRLFHLNDSGSETGSQFDIGIGPSGSQVVLVPNVNLTQPTPAGNTNMDVFSHIIPIGLPQGTSVWVRAAVNVSSPTCDLGGLVTPMDSAFHGMQDFAGVDMIGSTGTGTGTVITGGSAVKGSYAELTTSALPTAKDYAGLFFTFDLAAQTGPIYASLDIAIGASGSQVVIIPNMLLLLSSASNSMMDSEIFPVEVKAGSRLWARSCNIDNSSNNVGVTAYGVF